jgi:signal transduction histidine kinase/CheY-like chemotaxis protein
MPADAETDSEKAPSLPSGRCVSDAVAGAIILFLVSALANTVLFRIARTERIESLHDQLRSHASLAARWLDTAAHARLDSPAQTGTPEHLRALEVLQSLRDVHHTLDDLYSARAAEDGSCRIILETLPPGLGRSRPSTVGRPMDLTPALQHDLRASLASGAPQKLNKPESGSEGLGVMVPFGTNGEFIVASISAKNLAARLAVIRSAYAVALVFSALLALIGGLVIFWLRRREARARLMRPEDREFFRNITSVLPGVLYQARVSPRGKVLTTYVSDAARWVFEMEPSDLVPEPRAAFSRIHPGDRKRLLRGMAAVAWKPGEWREEFRVVLPKGGERWRFGTSYVQRLPDGSTLWNGFITDVTWRKEAEAALREGEESIRLNEHRLQLATHAGKVGTWDYDVATKKIVWNDVMYEMKKVDPATYDPNFASSIKFLHPADRRRVEKEFERCLRSDALSYEIECRVILPDGDIRHTRSSAVIIRDAHGAAVRVVGTEIDVTPQKLAVESALAADRAKSEFLAMMSHEIRTPMNGVLGFTALLKESPLSPQQRDYVETIEASGNNLLHLINDILDLSKVESGRVELQHSSFSLHNFLQEITILLRPRANEKRLEYGWDIAPGVPEFIESDRTRLGQILTNLLGNAVKFTARGRVWLQASASPLEAGRWTLRLTITDTGPGIPRDSLKRIFEPFYQTDLSSSRKHGGTGLGLPISQRLARLMGGDITVKSAPGQGAEFEVTVLVGEGRSLPLSDVTPRETPDMTRFAGRRVLIVDDDAVNRRLCVLQMAKLGLLAEAAESGSEAVSRCRENPYDAVIMDIQMPGMDGLEATRRIRELSSGHPPIIAFTANVMPDDRAKCLAAGMDDYLSKPLQLDDLATALSRWL